jgi:hypothetical protein
LNIAHIGNTSGVGSALATEQVAAGLCNKAEVYAFDDVTSKLFGGRMVKWNAGSKIERMMVRSKFFGEISKYDVWHYHYPHGGLWQELEKRKGGKKYVKHYHGDDLRGRHDDDFCLVSTPDLLQQAPNGVWLPNPINVAEIGAPVQRPEGGKIRIAHYPYYKNYRRENYYEEAFRALDDTKCEIVEVFDMPHDSVLQTVASCDIVAGKVLPDIGWFGKFELEGMALGKPVICYVSDELYEKYRPPVYRTTKETLARDLGRLVEDVQEQQRLSRAGSDYVRENHNVSKIVKKLESYYQQV